jgi:hypothetical protein
MGDSDSERNSNGTRRARVLVVVCSIILLGPRPETPSGNFSKAVSSSRKRKS